MIHSDHNPYQAPSDKESIGLGRNAARKIRKIKTIAAITSLGCAIGATFGSIIGIMKFETLSGGGTVPVNELANSIGFSLKTGMILMPAAFIAGVVWVICRQRLGSDHRIQASAPNVDSKEVGG
jgi:hypothetical protein